MEPPDQHDNQECGGGTGRCADPAPPRCLPWLGDGTRASLAQQLCSELTCEGGVGGEFPTIHQVGAQLSSKDWTELRFGLLLLPHERPVQR